MINGIMKQNIMPERSSRKDEKQRHWHQSVKDTKRLTVRFIINKWRKLGPILVGWQLVGRFTTPFLF